MISSIIILLTTIVIVVLFLSLAITYSYLSWGAVTYFFINWFLISTLNQNYDMNVINITYMQAIGLYLVISLFKVDTNTLKADQKTQKQYKLNSKRIKEIKQELKKLNVLDFNERETLENELKELNENKWHVWINFFMPWIMLFFGWIFYTLFFN